MHLRNVIEQLGYSPHEVAVYLAALELGGSTTTEIAEKARLPRTTTKLIIDSLHKKGLMNAYVQRRRKVWAAENPEKLLADLRESEATLKLAMPELQALRHETGAKPAVRVYSGVQEIKQIMNDILETKNHVSAILSLDDWVRTLGKTYLDSFVEARTRRYLRVRLLATKTKTSVALKAQDGAEMRTTQFLSESLGVSNANFIYGNKVAIISLNTKRPVGVLIEDQDIHHTMEVLFESLWRHSGGA